MIEHNSASAAAHWLSLAAAPTFGMMALLSFVGGDGLAMICSAGQESPLSGMTAMYLLMSAFHSGPWLRLMSGSEAPPGDRKSN
jgi:hypothetical protein